MTNDKSKKHNIILIGSYGRGNIGDDAFFEIFKKYLANHNIWFNSALDSMKDLPPSFNIFPTTFTKDIIKKIKILLNADTVIYGGGDLWVTLDGGKRYNSSLVKMLLINLICKLLGKKVFYLGVGAGKLKGYSLFLAQSSAKLANHIIFRESRSPKVLSLDNDKFEIASDLASLTQIPVNKLIRTNNKIVIGLSLLYYIPNPKKNFNNYLEQIAKAINELDPDEYKVVLMPMLYQAETKNNDIWASQEFIKKINSKIEISILHTESVSAFIQQLQNIDFCIGTRLHSNILATLVGTPCLGISYRPKVKQFFVEHDLSDYVINFEQLNDLPNKIKQQLKSLENSSQIQSDFAKARTKLINEAHIYDQFFKNIYKERQNNYTNISLKVFGLFSVLYSLILIGLRSGIGQYWDWSLPLYRDQFTNYFTRGADSWIQTDFGSTLGYKSDLMLRWLLSNLAYIPLQAETILYVSLVVLFATGSTLIFKICKKNGVNNPASVLCGLIAFVNPAIFYKLLAGHYLYIVSFAIFIYLIYFLQNFNKNKLVSYIHLGLILGLISPQFQFIFFGLLYLFVDILFNRKKYNYKLLPISLGLIVLTNISWLYNFIFQVENLEAISNNAQKGSFLAASSQTLTSIFNLTFAKGTLINRNYDPNFVNYFYGFSLILTLIALVKIWQLYQGQIKLKSVLNNKKNWHYLTLLSILVILSTGILQFIDLPIITSLAPIFREVGHFAPLIVLIYGLLIFANMSSLSKYFKIGFYMYLTVFLALNIYTFNTSLPTVNFADYRNNFDQFKNFDLQDGSKFRVLTYPFFNQYSYSGNQTKTLDGFLLNNTGWDSYSAFSGYEIASVGIPKSEFTDFYLYKFLKTRDLSYLTDRNIKYIFDFSKIYESNINKYLPPASYNNELDIIKNIPNLLEDLMAKNPGLLTKISDNIYRINYSKTRIYGNNNLKFSSNSSTNYTIQLKNITGQQKITFLENYNPGWDLSLREPTGQLDNCNEVSTNSRNLSTQCQDTKAQDTKITPLGNIHQANSDKFNTWDFNTDYITKRYPKELYKINPDKSIDIELNLNFKPQDNFVIAKNLNLVTIILSILYIIIQKIRTPKI